MEYRKTSNFGIIKNLLYANQASGRRKQVRAICTNNCTLSFIYEGQSYKGTIHDISLSHFSCRFPEDMADIPLYEKICNIQLNIKGLRVRSDAVFCMKRLSAEESISVFTFINNLGKSGLDILTRQLLLPRIYEIMADNCSAILNRLFYLQQKPDKQQNDNIQKNEVSPQNNQATGTGKKE